MVGFVAWFIAQFMKVCPFPTPAALAAHPLAFADRNSAHVGVLSLSMGAAPLTELHDPPPPSPPSSFHFRAPDGTVLHGKQIFTHRARKGKWRLKAFVDSGGMPSSHSSLCSVTPNPLPPLPIPFSCPPPPPTHPPPFLCPGGFSCPRALAIYLPTPVPSHLPPLALRGLLAFGFYLVLSLSQERPAPACPSLPPILAPLPTHSIMAIMQLLSFPPVCPLLFVASILQGVTTAVGLSQGFTSPLFAVAICFSVIVMYDAAGVRRHAGEQ